MRFLLLFLSAALPLQLGAQSEDAAIPALGAKVTRLRFFEGARTPPTLRDRQYGVRFDSAAARSIYVEIGLSYPPARAAVSVKVDCAYTAPGGAPAGVATVAVQADAGWELSVHAGGTGGDTPGNWKAGSYGVVCRFGGKVIATGSFEIARPVATASLRGPERAPSSLRGPERAEAISPAQPSPKAPNRPAPKSNEKPLPAFGGLKAKVVAIKMFETGGDIPDQKNRVVGTSFDALTSRFINFEFELEYPRAAKHTEFEIPCRIEGPDSAARVPTLRGTVEPGWIGSYHVTGWGSRDRGAWPEGSYRVTCVEQGQTVATAEFTVVKARAAVEALGASLTHLKFFQSLAERLPVESRLYGTRFDSRTIRWIKTEFGLVYPSVPAPVTFAVECVYTFPDGTMRPVTSERRVPAAWTGSVHAQGIGWDKIGNWPVGGYKVSCRSDGREFAAGSFEVVDGGAVPAITAGGSLKFFGRKAGAPAVPSYAAGFEAGTFDTLYAEAGLPARSAGDSTAFRCALTDPAGVTSAFSVAGEVKDRSLTGTGRINSLDGPRMRGSYRVECRTGTRAVLSDRFEITGKPDIAAADARVVASALYEGADTPPDDEVVPDITFSAARVRSLWLVALLDHPTEAGGGALAYSCKILTGKNVALSDTGPQRLVLAPGDRSIVLRQRFVTAPRQRWAPGKLQLRCTSGGAVFLQQAVDLTR